MLFLDTHFWYANNNLCKTEVNASSSFILKYKCNIWRKQGERDSHSFRDSVLLNEGQQYWTHVTTHTYAHFYLIKIKISLHTKDLCELKCVWLHIWSDRVWIDRELYKLAVLLKCVHVVTHCMKGKGVKQSHPSLIFYL